MRSKSLRERQAKDFSEQLDSLRHKYEQQVRILVRSPRRCVYGFAPACADVAVEKSPFARAAVAQSDLCWYHYTLYARRLTPI